jgi:hypothetical protein
MIRLAWASGSGDLGMTSDNMFEEFQNFCYHVGLALITWQDVEEAHFKLFFKLVGAPNEKIASLAYHSIESFENRHKMVDRMLVLFCKQNKHTGTAMKFWSNAEGGLNKELKEANKNRNKLAHYRWENDIIGQKELFDGSVVIEFGEPKLQPSSYNLVSRMLGHTPDRLEHNLNVGSIGKYIKTFRDLAEKLDRFHIALPAWPLEASIMRTIGLPPKRIEESRRSRPKKKPLTDR